MRKSLAAISLSAVSLAGLGAGFALGTPGISSAQTASTTAPTTAPTTAGSSATPATPSTTTDDAAAKGPHQANGKTESPLTGDDLAKATVAAATAAPGSTVVRAETDADGDAFEVHITKADGTKATVKLNADFTVRIVEADGGHGGKGGGSMGHGGMRGGANLGVAATAIGVTEADLRTALQGGQTIAQVAQAHNVTADAVIAALQADLQTRLDKQVIAGTITQAQADQRKADAATRYANLVNNVIPAGGHGKGHGAAGANGSATTTPSTTTA